MAILNLQGGQEKYLKDLICRDNPDLLEFPDSYFKPIGDVFVYPDGYAGVFLTGNPGNVSQIQISGKVPVKYRRIDLRSYFKNIERGLYYKNPTSIHQILPQISRQFGIELNPDEIHDDVLSGEDTGTATVRFKFSEARSFVLNSNSFTIDWEPAPYEYLSDVLSVSELSGHEPEIPYLELIEGIFTVSELNGLVPVPLVPQWDKISSTWFLPATQWQYIDLIWFYTTNGAYNAGTLAAVVNLASGGKQGTWVCENSATKPNLFNSAIVSNINNTEYCGLRKPHRLLTISPVAGLTGGEGQIKVFYDITDLDREEFVLDDSQVTLRQWLNSMTAPVNAYWDVNKAPQLFNVVTGGKYGSWVAAANGGALRNLWGSGLSHNEWGNWTVNGKTYNRRAKWALYNSNTYSVTSKGTLTVYYNAA